MNWQERLRRALGGDLDLCIAPVFRLDGQQIVLTMGELEEAYERRRLHINGYQSTLQHAIRQESKGEDMSTPRRAVAFWFQKGDGVGGSVPVDLPLPFVQGLISTVRNSGLEVVLLTYQLVSNVPAGILVRQAADFLTADIFYTLLPLVPLQCLADLVRARALHQGIAGGFFMRKYVDWSACTLSREP
jgi:hypothetical protein